MIRACLFYTGYTVATIVWGALSVLVAWPLPPKARFDFVIVRWTRFVLWWLKVTCGITHEIEGIENLPSEPCVVLVKHQSTWETLFVQTLVSPQATLIKRELLWIPFFGWAFALVKPIAINRRDARGALRQLIDQGKARLADGHWVTLFPEGTRLPWGESGAFHSGGAALARAAKCPIVVVAHDAGRHWPAHQLRKVPGKIHVRISEPIQTSDKKTKEINELGKSWLDAEMHSLAASKGGAAVSA